MPDIVHESKCLRVLMWCHKAPGSRANAMATRERTQALKQGICAEYTHAAKVMTSLWSVNSFCAPLTPLRGAACTQEFGGEGGGGLGWMICQAVSHLLPLFLRQHSEMSSSLHLVVIVPSPRSGWTHTDGAAKYLLSIHLLNSVLRRLFLLECHKAKAP